MKHHEAARRLQRTASHLSVSPLVETQVFQNVPAKAVVDFLSQYRSGYRDTFFGPTLMTYRDQEIEMNTSMAEQYACTQLSENPI